MALRTRRPTLVDRFLRSAETLVDPLLQGVEDVAVATESSGELQCPCRLLKVALAQALLDGGGGNGNLALSALAFGRNRLLGLLPPFASIPLASTRS